MEELAQPMKRGSECAAGAAFGAGVGLCTCINTTGLAKVKSKSGEPRTEEVILGDVAFMFHVHIATAWKDVYSIFLRVRVQCALLQPVRPFD